MRGRPLLLIGSLIVGLFMAGGACGGDPVTGPPLGSVNFAPKLVLTVGADKVTAALGPRTDEAVRTDPPRVPSGTVVEIVNGDQRDHRLHAGTLFDTGTMRPGDRTTVVVTNDSGQDLTAELTDPADPAVRGTLEILAAPVA